eukprot:CAMPEP_0178415356 /NCGR_PEP_ID=MMETSP0689_2-20121128/23509_1 /TAXON_ID=160604 /ORGANISM="Amphidinium massartii, Strain CS-259" /LENGTH=120 /DNA_ID=CAMNT_0020036673 /DNA_START=619 /DNA_END=981 /DNA_ORIENTATION=-
MRSPTVLGAVGTFIMPIAAADGQTALPFLAAVFAMVFALVTAGLWIHVLCLAGSNLTSVEQYMPAKNPYNLPSTLDNLRQLFGPFDIYILLPVTPSLQLDGTQFPTAGAEAPAGNYGSVS